MYFLAQFHLQDSGNIHSCCCGMSCRTASKTTSFQLLEFVNMVNELMPGLTQSAAVLTCLWSGAKYYKLCRISNDRMIVMQLLRPFARQARDCLHMIRLSIIVLGEALQEKRWLESVICLPAMYGYTPVHLMLSGAVPHIFLDTCCKKLVNCCDWWGEHRSCTIRQGTERSRKMP